MPGLLIVLCGPSGVGKSTLSKRLAEEADVEYVPAVTTRERRPGDEKGKAYDYVDESEFFSRLDTGLFLEYAQNYDEYYATPRHPAAGLARRRSRRAAGDRRPRGPAGPAPLPVGPAVFILPPDEATLEQRLIARGRDDPKQIAKRFRAARREIHMAKGSRAFDSMVVNDDLEQAMADLRKLLKHRRSTASTGGA